MVNAVVVTAFAKALDEAARIDELMEEDTFDSNPKYSPENMPYLGVPITCKEIIFVKVYLQNKETYYNITRKNPR